MITKMGWDVSYKLNFKNIFLLKANQIRRYIMEDAAIKRIHPQQFDVAHFKRAVILFIKFCSKLTISQK